ncbi:MAG TPA: helix-turn-helix transcriptional regulator [Alphaproteobacteria bacterium]|nr:helix-turn-helix transcriptional regulator [Alphaproteobacteria bacterium]
MAGPVQNDIIYRGFGNLIQELRKKIGYSQTQLGERIGLSRTSVTNIEGGRQHVALHQIYQLAEALEVTPDSLLPAKANFLPENEELKRLADPQVASWLSKIVETKEPQPNDPTRKPS